MRRILCCFTARDIDDLGPIPLAVRERPSPKESTISERDEGGYALTAASKLSGSLDHRPQEKATALISPFASFDERQGDIIEPAEPLSSAAAILKPLRTKSDAGAAGCGSSSKDSNANSAASAAAAAAVYTSAPSAPSALLLRSLPTVDLNRLRRRPPPHDTAVTRRPRPQSAAAEDHPWEGPEDPQLRLLRHKRSLIRHYSFTRLSLSRWAKCQAVSQGVGLERVWRKAVFGLTRKINEGSFCLFYLANLA